MDVEIATERPWLAHYDPGVPRTLAYPRAPLQQFLTDTAARHPHATATIFGAVVGHRLIEGSLTYAELDRLAHRFAAGLQSLGVRRGDRVALVLPNCPQFVIAFYGALRAGAVVVPCNPLYTAPELQRQVADSGAETVVALSRLQPVVRAAREATAIRNVILTNIKEYYPTLLRLMFTAARERRDGYRTTADRAAGERFFPDVLRAGNGLQPVSVDPADTAVLQYTGGTTGVAKGAVLSHRALVANVLQSRSWNSTLVEARERGVDVMPLFHVYGLTVIMGVSVATATAMVLIPRFDLEHILLAIQRHRPRSFAGAPRIYVAAVSASDLARYDLRSVEVFQSGSAPLPLEVQTQFEQLAGGGRVLEGYGLTEAGPVTHSTPRRGQRKFGSIGVPIPDVDAKIVDLETGTREMPVGEAGELVVRGPNVMDGYYKRPDETALALRDGWLYTGDVARVDEDGYFYIVDRKKELIIVSGYNVYPREVEEALYAHAAVLEAAAIGVPDRERGEVVKAFIVLRPGASASADELRAHCASSLARFKIPAEIEFRAELPKSAVGKVLRRALADEERASRVAKETAGGRG
ncbi:MAG TPA: long-chain fatty acid--CoA ligase [Candidatus Acidoferrales bacterium]|nr:long-chain fatty acid--CoA ligase [Candidatus Acidoferrales bacterium]